LIKDVVENKMKVRVATLNPKNNKIEYQHPVDFQKFYYKGKMLNIESRQISLLVTPEHKLYVRKAWDAKKRRPFSFIPAMRLPRHVEFKRDADWDGVEKQVFVLPTVQRKSNKGNPVILKNIQLIKMDDWLRFFGVWLAEGSAFMDKGKYKVHISQHDERKRKVILEWCKKCGFNAREKSDGILIWSKQLYSYLKQLGHAEDKFIPHELKQLGKRQLKILFDSLMFGDGFETEGGGWIYGTTSKQLADDIHEIVLKLGYVVTIHTRKEGSVAFNKYRRKRLYVLSITESQKTPSVGHHRDPRKWINYEGYVYDITVPKYHIIYVRRKGKSIWCSNCKADGVTLLDYWLESYDSSVATFWVEVDSIPASPSTVDIYVYYGNPSATTTSNIKNTFYVGDDFNDGVVDTDWIQDKSSTGTNTITEHDGYLDIDKTYRHVYCHVEQTGIPDGLEAVTKIMWLTDNEATWAGGLGIWFNGLDWVKIRRHAPDDKIKFLDCINGTSSLVAASTDTHPINVWRWLKFIITSSNVKAYYSTDGETWTLLASITRDTGWTIDASSRVILGSGFEDSSHTNPDWDNDYASPVSGTCEYHFDYVFVRKYVDPEPTHGAWGSEERRVGIRRLKGRGGDARSRLWFKPLLRM